MVDLQVVIAGPAPRATDGVGSGGLGGLYSTQQQSRSGERAVETIDKLADIWDVVVDKLTALAATAHQVASSSPFELDSIEFNVGIEAGISVGLVTKGDASVSLTFTRKPVLHDAPVPVTVPESVAVAVDATVVGIG